MYKVLTEAKHLETMNIDGSYCRSGKQMAPASYNAQVTHKLLGDTTYCTRKGGTWVPQEFQQTSVTGYFASAELSRFAQFVRKPSTNLNYHV
eukprot:CAMPEP_0176463688 /NCGR_PEP_ID=MMETSP0127-20121128/36046_1 /TAXON_ID=938130 /ORGANISM="Platyophrya macrostoma, Strain WH" /LENGTH=91 /DNA_ID=CAMNT_0017855913 /DNA_START=38 /DNA_END=309 /DNA_ORIENTATION=+